MLSFRRPSMAARDATYDLGKLPKNSIRDIENKGLILRFWAFCPKSTSRYGWRLDRLIRSLAAGRARPARSIEEEIIRPETYWACCLAMDTTARPVTKSTNMSTMSRFSRAPPPANSRQTSTPHSAPTMVEPCPRA